MFDEIIVSPFLQVLRQKLNEAGLNDTKIVAADGTWEPISFDIQLDKELAAAVDIIGQVSLCGYLYARLFVVFFPGNLESRRHP